MFQSFATIPSYPDHDVPSSDVSFGRRIARPREIVFHERSVGVVPLETDSENDLTARFSILAHVPISDLRSNHEGVSRSSFLIHAAHRSSFCMREWYNITLYAPPTRENAQLRPTLGKP